MSADPHTLTGAYAVDALSDTERLAFERHLDACPACAQEARELSEATAWLGTAAPARPPADLWERVRTGAAATSQLPPAAARPGQRRAGRAGARGGRRFAALLAAAAVLLVAAVSLVALDLGRAGRPGRPVDLVAAVLRAPDARRVVAALPDGTGQAAVVVSRGEGRAVFEASGLPPAPAARTYQLWVVDRAGPRPAGLVDGGGRVTRLLEGRVDGTEQVAMTVERRGGAARPTSEPVVVVDLDP
jgi:hypothetical protein